jgi:hypothetical protein
MGAILPAVALLLREADVQELIEIDDVIAGIEAAMTELGRGTAQNEPRRRTFAPGGLLNVMFASYPAAPGSRPTRSLMGGFASWSCFSGWTVRFRL